MKPPAIVEPSIQDQHEAATIQTMIFVKRKRDRRACFLVGERIARLLERKALPKGQTNVFAKKLFGRDWDYLRLFVSLYYAPPEELDEAEKEQSERGWVNDHTDEPRRTLNLLKWYRKSRSDEGSDSDPSQTQGSPRTPDDTDWLTQLVGDCRKLLHGLDDKSHKVCILSVPYLWQEDYGHPDQIGLELTIGEYLRTLLMDVFKQVFRVMDDRGTLWLVMGDHVASGARQAEPEGGWRKHKQPAKPADEIRHGNMRRLPERLAAGLENIGFMYRGEVIWAKPGLTSHGGTKVQPTHEKILMFSKSTSYDFYQKAVQEIAVDPLSSRPGAKGRRQGRIRPITPLKDLGSVWPVPRETLKEGIAAFPVEVALRAILYSTKPGEHVLDPFGGTGTVGIAAKMTGRRCTLIELVPTTAAIATNRIAAAPSCGSTESNRRLYGSDDMPPAGMPYVVDDDITITRLSERLAGAERRIDWLSESLRLVGEFADQIIADFAPDAWIEAFNERCLTEFPESGRSAPVTSRESEGEI